MGVAVTRPSKHLVDDGLYEEDEEKSEAEEELCKGILQLQHGRRHHSQPRGSLQGLPHLAKMKFCLFSITRHSRSDVGQLADLTDVTLVSEDAF